MPFKLLKSYDCKKFSLRRFQVRSHKGGVKITKLIKSFDRSKKFVVWQFQKFPYIANFCGEFCVS